MAHASQPDIPGPSPSSKQGRARIAKRRVPRAGLGNARSETDPTFNDEASDGDSDPSPFASAAEGEAVSSTPGKPTNPDDRETAAAPSGGHQLVVKQLDKSEHQAAFVRHQTVVEARLKQHLRIQLLRDREEAAALDPTSGRYLDFVERWSTHGVNISRDAEQADRDYHAAFSRHGVAVDPLTSPSALATAKKSRRPLIIWALLLFLSSGVLIFLFVARPWEKKGSAEVKPPAPDAPLAQTSSAPPAPLPPKVTSNPVPANSEPPVVSPTPPATQTAASPPTIVKSVPTAKTTAAPEPTHTATPAPAKTTQPGSGLYFPTPTP